MWTLPWYTEMGVLEVHICTPGHTKKRKVDYNLPDLTCLPNGQRRAVIAWVGADEARTYVEAASIMGVALPTLKSHLARVRRNHPQLYGELMAVRKRQLKIRHRIALENARQHGGESLSDVARRLTGSPDPFEGIHDWKYVGSVNERSGYQPVKCANCIIVSKVCRDVTHSKP